VQLRSKDTAMRFLFLIANIIWATCAFGTEVKDPVHDANRSVIEGTLLQVSKLPLPEGNDYPDCYYTAIIDIDHIAFGQSIPKKIILVLPGFFSRKYSAEAKYKAGDKVHATVVTFASMPDKVRQTQQADEIEDVDLDFYFPAKIDLVQEFKNISNPVPFAGKNLKGAASTDFQPINLKAKAARQNQILHDLEEIDSLLSKHGGDWDKWYDSLKDFRAQYKKQLDAKAQRWVDDSFFSAGQITYGKGYCPEFVKSVISFKNYLAARNVDLILVRIPQKGEIVDDLFVPVSADLIANPYLLRMYRELLEADVEIITDIIPRLKESRLKYPLMYWYQSFAEEHPAEGTAWVVAETLAKRLNRYETIRNAPKGNFELRQALLPTYSFRWPEGNSKFNPSENVQFTSVSVGNNGTLALKQGIESPVLVVGSSFIGSPSLEQSGNIPSYLAYLTGIVPDILYRNGSNATIPRTIAREGDTFLKNRSVCLFPLVPWAIHSALDSPPIIDPTKSKKILLTSYFGDILQTHIQFVTGTPKHVFSYSKEGSLTVQARDKESRNGGNFSLVLPKKILEFPFFMLEIESQNRDIAVIKVSYGTQTDTVHRSYSQTNSDEIFVFKSGTNIVADFDVNNISMTVPTIIKSIKIYGLRN